MASQQQIEDDAGQAWVEYWHRELKHVNMHLNMIQMLRRTFMTGYKEGRKDG